MGNATSQVVSKMDLKKYTDEASNYIQQNMTSSASQDAFIVQSTTLDNVKYYGCDLEISQTGSITLEKITTNDPEKTKGLLDKLSSVLENDKSVQTVLLELVKGDQKKYEENVDIVKNYLKSSSSIESMTKSIQSVAIGQTIDLKNVTVDLCGELLYKKYNIPGTPPCPENVKCPIGNQANIKIVASQAVNGYVDILKNAPLNLDNTPTPRPTPASGSPTGSVSGSVSGSGSGKGSELETWQIALIIAAICLVVVIIVVVIIKSSP